jgi:Zn-finger nucleic acid-binding protein
MSVAPHCPGCVTVQLHAGEARGLHLHACGQCGGVWLKPDEAARILRPLYTPNGLPGRSSARRCPDCSQVMTEWTVGATDVLLDSCPHDGTWFDRDEIEQLAHAAASMRDRPAPQFARAASDLAPVALAGAAAAIAVQAIAHSDGLHAADQLPPEQKDSMAAVAVEAVIYAPDAAFAVAEVSAAAADVGVEAAGAGIEAAGGLLEGLLEFIGGLFS